MFQIKNSEMVLLFNERKYLKISYRKYKCRKEINNEVYFPECFKWEVLIWFILHIYERLLNISPDNHMVCIKDQRTGVYYK